MPVDEMFIYLRVKNAGKAVEFYQEAFGASEKFRLVEPGGQIGHVELEIGGTTWGCGKQKKSGLYLDINLRCESRIRRTAPSRRSTQQCCC